MTCGEMDLMRVYPALMDRPRAHRLPPHPTRRPPHDVAFRANFDTHTPILVPSSPRLPGSPCSLALALAFPPSLPSAHPGWVVHAAQLVLVNELCERSKCTVQRAIEMLLIAVCNDFDIIAPEFRARIRPRRYHSGSHYHRRRVPPSPHRLRTRWILGHRSLVVSWQRFE